MTQNTPPPLPTHPRSRFARWSRRCAWSFGGLCGAYIVYWLLVAGAVWGFAAAVMNQNVRGNRLAVDSAAVSGFPLAFDMRFQGLELAAQDMGLAWQPPEGDLKVRVPAYAPWSFDLDLSGDHKLAPLARPELASTIEVSSGYLRSRFSTGPIPNEVDLNLGAVSGQILDRFPVESEALRFHFQRPGTRSTLDAQARDLRLPPEATIKLAEALSALPFIRGARADQLAPAVGSFLELAELRGYAEPALPATPNRSSMARWQAQGGVLRLDRLSTKLQRLALDGSGSLYLNEELQPRGRIDLALKGLDDFIKTLADTGILTSAQARFAIAMMGRMQRGGAGADGGLALPIELSDAGMSIGPVFLGPVPRFDW